MTKLEIITKCDIKRDELVHQGDILTNVEYIEYADIVDGNIEISKIRFPKVIVLTQECDSVQDYNNRKDCYSKMQEDKEVKTNQFLLSTIVAPLYNLNDIVLGEHLSNINIIKDGNITDSVLKYERINSDNKRKLMSNQIDRYHYLKIEINGKYVEYVIDFKHYFTVNTERIIKHKQKHNFFVSILPVFRESINQRFSNFLSRIGLPETEIEKCEE